MLLFLIASSIAGFGGILLFNQFVLQLERRILQDELVTEIVQREQANYFVKLALVETIPILLVIVGFNQMEGYILANSTRYMMTGLYLLLIGFIGLHALLNHRRLMKHQHHNTSLLHSVAIIGFLTISSIPIISIVSLFIVM